MRAKTLSEARWILLILALATAAAWFLSAGLSLVFLVLFLIDGRIVYRQHRDGICLDARDPNCSEKNEAMTWAFENLRATIVVRQLTGAIARRIVAWAEVGDELKKADRFGMIRFGSRTELYLPLNAEVFVKVGDHVLGGSTIIARLPNDLTVRETEYLASAKSASPLREGERIEVRGFVETPSSKTLTLPSPLRS